MLDEKKKKEIEINTHSASCSFSFEPAPPGCERTLISLRVSSFSGRPATNRLTVTRVLRSNPVCRIGPRELPSSKCSVFLRPFLPCCICVCAWGIRGRWSSTPPLTNSTGQCSHSFRSCCCFTTRLALRSVGCYCAFVGLPRLRWWR